MTPRSEQLGKSSSAGPEASREIAGRPQERPDVLRKPNKEDIAADLKNLYRKVGETGIKIDEINAQMEELKNPKGADRYASKETTIELLKKLQEEKNFHTARKENFDRLVADLESKLERSS